MSHLIGLVGLIFLLLGCQVKEQTDAGILIAGNVPTTNAFTLGLPSNGSYQQGTNLNFTLTHPFDVTVVGNPRLTLTVGATTKYADYISGSGTKILTFRYTVEAAMNDTDGIAVATTVDLNGGTITFDVATAALTTISVGSTTKILVDTTTPSVSSTTLGTQGIYKLAQKVNVTVVFDEKVVVTGSPQVQINLSGVTKNATYASGTGTTSLVFSYTVVTTDKDLDGLDLLSTSLNSGTIKDVAGNIATFAVTPGPMTGIYVHDVPTLITPVTASANKTYVEGETITLTAVFSRATTVTGSPRIALDIGGVTEYATYQSGSGTTSLVFDFVVGAGDVDTNGISVTGVVALNGGTLIDSNIDPVLALTFTAPSTTLVKVDGVAPSITSITPPANATYLISQQMNFSVVFSDTVTVTGTPTLDFVAGVTTINSTYISGSGTNTLLFRYTPTAGIADADGIALSAVNLTSGTIKDSSGNDIDVTIPAVDTSAVLIDAILPSIISVTAPANTTYLVGTTMDFSVLFSAAVTVTGTPSLAFVTSDGTKAATYLSGSGSTTLVFRYTVVSNDYDYDGITVNSPLALNAGTILDSNSYASTLTFTPPTTTSVLVDASPALISSVTIPVTGTYGDGELLNFTVIFTKNVTITGTPRLSLDLNGSPVFANYQSGSGTKNIIFRRTIGSPDVDSDGIGLSSPVGLNSGTIKDSNTINATLTFTVPNTSGILVDSQAPTITLVSAPSSNTYVTGQNLNFTVDYSEIVNVTGTPRLTLTIGSTTRYANYLSGSGSSSLVFRHTVLSNDLDSNGIAMTASLDNNSGTIRDVSSNNAATTLTAPILTAVLVDAIIPTISSVTAPANAVYSNSAVMNFTVNYLKAVTVVGTPRIHLDILGVTKYATYVSGSGTTALVFRYTPATTDFDMNGTATQNSNDIDLNAGTMKDVLNNNADVALGSIDLAKVYVSYPGLGAWFDVDDATKITTVFSTPNYQTSDFNDKSGNNRNATQAAAADRPYYLSSGFGTQNKPYIQNNITDFMNLASNVASVQHVIMIFRTPATIATAPIFATTAGMLMGTTLSGTGALSFNTVAKWKINGGALSATAATSSTASTLVANTCYIASGVYTTAQNPTVQRLGSTTFLGRYAEVLIYTSAVTLTNADLTVIHSYLNTKYGCY
jgi:hypothetical protein